MTGKLLWALALAAMVLVGCSGGGGSAMVASEVGDVAAGEELFRQLVIGEYIPGCVNCHSVEPGVVLVGPSLAGIGVAAATRVTGKSAEDYLRESIINPNAYIAEGFPAGYMYVDYAADLSEEQVNNLVAYMLTLE